MFSRERGEADHLIRGLKKHPVLGREEEKRLAVLYRDTGDPGAARMLVEGHLRLVVKIARRCCYQGSSLPDLIQEGTLGLMKAVTKYDPDRGVRLSTYAGWWIRAYIYRHNMVNGRIVRVVTTLPQRKLFFALRREQGKLSATGDPVRPTDLARRLGVAERDVVQMQEHLSARDVDLDGGFSDGAEGMGAELRAHQPQPDEAFATQEIRRAVGSVLVALEGSLDERQKVILMGRLCADDPMTLQQVGRRFGITRERVRQLEKGLKRQLHVRLAPLGDPAGEPARAA